MHDSSELFYVGNVPSNVRFSQSIALLYVFEDNEAVIKMIIKGRSDRINLDPRIQIRYIDTEHQMADIMTNGHFTRDEWNNLL